MRTARPRRLRAVGYEGGLSPGPVLLSVFEHGQLRVIEAIARKTRHRAAQLGRRCLGNDRSAAHHHDVFHAKTTQWHPPIA